MREDEKTRSKVILKGKGDPHHNQILFKLSFPFLFVHVFFLNFFRNHLYTLITHLF
jgi:hypothetical protein